MKLIKLFNFFVITIACVHMAFRTLSIYPADFLPTRYVKFHVTQVDGVPYAFQGSYRVYTDDGLYINRDSLIKWKFNSGDIAGHMYKLHNEIGDISCKALVNGYRVYWPVGLFPNILSIQCS